MAQPLANEAAVLLRPNRERPKLGLRERDWQPIAPTEAEVAREMARRLREMARRLHETAAGRVPK